MSATEHDNGDSSGSSARNDDKDDDALYNDAAAASTRRESVAFTGTCARYIADVCVARRPDKASSQLCVLSLGFDLEGVAAELIRATAARDVQQQQHMFCIVLPDGLLPGTITRIATALQRHLATVCAAPRHATHAPRDDNDKEDDDVVTTTTAATTTTRTMSAALPQHRRASSRRTAQQPPQQQQRHHDAASTSSAASGNNNSSSSNGTSHNVHVYAMDEGTSTRERCAAYQRGGVVVCASRTLCADLLHRRLAPDLVALAVVVFPHGPLGASMKETLTPSLAFAVEMLLRGGADVSMRSRRGRGRGGEALLPIRITASSGGAVASVAAAGDADADDVAADAAAMTRGPHIVLLSDHPRLMQYLVQRHHVGLDRFTHQMHIGDVQLFPRFRLDLMTHFATLTRTRPLRVDRVVVHVSAAARALDRLLLTIVLEVLSELHSLDARLERAAEAAAAARTGGAQTRQRRRRRGRSGERDGSAGAHDDDDDDGDDDDGGGEVGALRAVSPSRRGSSTHRAAAVAALADMDEDAAHLLPRVRTRLDDVVLHGSSNNNNSSSSSRSTADDAGDCSGRQPQALMSGNSNTATAALLQRTLRYVHKPWRDKASIKRIHFTLIEPDVCGDVQYSELDTDLSVALRANEPTWPYRALTESLLDVRRLRRALQHGNSFDFLFALDRLLQKRAGGGNNNSYNNNSYSSSSSTGAAPTALWTLSSHFADVVTVATQRIGKVELRMMHSSPTNSTVAADATTATTAPRAAVPSATAASRAVMTIDCDDDVVAVDDDDDDDVVCVDDEDCQQQQQLQTVTTAHTTTMPPPPPRAQPRPEAAAGAAAATTTSTAAADADGIPTMVLIPNNEELSYEDELLYRLTISWCRDTRRRSKRRQHDNNSSNATAHATPQQGDNDDDDDDDVVAPALLIVAFGQRALGRCVERLVHSHDDYQRAQFEAFLSHYGERAGVGVHLATTTAATTAAVTSNNGNANEDDGVHTVPPPRRRERQQQHKTHHRHRRRRASSTASHSNSSSSNNNSGDCCKQECLSPVTDAASLASWLATGGRARRGGQCSRRCKKDKKSDDDDSSDDSSVDDDDDAKAKRTAGAAAQASVSSTSDSESNSRSHDASSSSAAVDDDDDDEDDDEDDEALFGDGATPQRGVNRVPSLLFSQPLAAMAAAASTPARQTTTTAAATTTSTSQYAAHNILLSQTPHAATRTAHDPRHRQHRAHFVVERLGTGVAMLAAADDDDDEADNDDNTNNRGNDKSRGDEATTLLLPADALPTSTSSSVTAAEETRRHGARARCERPRVVVVDGAYTRTADLVAMIRGTHPWLCTTTRLTTTTTTTATTRTHAHKVDDDDANNSSSKKKKTTAAAAVATDVTKATRPLRVRVRRVVLTQQNLPLLRMLEMVQDALDARVLREVRVQLVTSAFAEDEFRTAVAHEREAFQSLAHAKATLTGTLLVDRAALRRTEAALERVMTYTRGRQTTAASLMRRQQQQQQQQRRGGSAADRYRGLLDDAGEDDGDGAAQPLIVFDEREFRSTLPYELYSKGVDLVPLTLTTADYVLSERYAVERKSVADYNQSLQSGRITQQLAALSRRYEYAMCLIEFDRVAPFRLTYTTAWRSTSDGAAMAVLWARTARLMAAHPRVTFLWARSPAHSASMLAALKRGPAADNVDPSDPMLTGGVGLEVDDGGGGGGGSGAASKELAHYAARVLSRLPGVTPSNAPRLMQAAGSLAGLATLAKASLCAAIGEEHGEQLHRFLHEPFVESVDE